MALPVRFWPAASPVVKLNRKNKNLLAENCSISCRRPARVVASASLLIAAKLAVTQSPKARAALALSKPKVGARCMTSAITVVRTPPAACSSFMPRL